MPLPEDFLAILTKVASHPAFQQIAPFAILFLVPLLILLCQAHITSLFYSLSMVLENLSLILPWNWYSGHGSTSSGRKKQKKLVRTRAEQLGARRDASGSGSRGNDDGYYPGIVNISGTYCFMDSTLQAMASLTYLQPYIDEIHSKAEAFDVPTPVIDALRDILHTLNNPISSPRAIRPLEMIDALAQHSKGKHNSLFSSREHQDAQELFQLVSECIKTEAAAVDKESSRDRGLGGLSQDSPHANRELAKSVFDGLTANRRSCRECGYTEAVMHFAFDNWQLSVPRAASCYLQDCLSDYTRLEILEDCICQKCSMVATWKRLEDEAEKLSQDASGHDASSSKKKRAREARKLASRVKAALTEGRIEDEIRGVKLEKVFSRESTKQAMIARPPPILALHLNRSSWGHYATKNNCHILFPELLDLTPYTTSGRLSTVPDKPISDQGPYLPRSTTPTPATFTTRVLYRLAAVVCHFGQHSFGHYICYRRKPRPLSAGAKRFAPPKLACPLGCSCERCEIYGSIRDEDESDPNAKPISSVSPPGQGWLRISDERVEEVGIEEVLREGSAAFMLYYERVVQPGVYLSSSPRSSEETLKPRMNGSVASLHTVLTGASVKTEETAVEQKEKIVAPIPRVPGARIVRNVSTTRSRSSSVSPPSHNTVLSSGLPHPLANGVADQRSDSNPLQNGDASHHHQSKPKPSTPTSPSSSPRKKPRSKTSSHPEHNTPPTELHMLSSSATSSTSNMVNTSTDGNKLTTVVS